MQNFNVADLLKKGKDAFNKNDLKSASLIFHEVVDLDPNNVEAYFYLGNSFHMRGELGKAIRSFQRVIELDPAHTDASISLSVLFNDIGKYEEAKAIFENANKQIKISNSEGLADKHINKKFSLKHYEIAEMYASYHRFDESLFEYNKAYALDPDNLEIRIKIAKALSKKGFMSKAFEELKKLKNENPGYIPGRMALALLYYSVGNIIEAQSEWTNILHKEPTHDEARMYLDLSKSATETTL